MNSNDLLMTLVVVTALAFDFTNGFHDTGNAMAASIATAALADEPLAAQNPAAISAAIERLIAEPPSETDIERVRARLSTAGWNV